MIAGRPVTFRKGRPVELGNEAKTRLRRTIVFLAACVALNSTAFGIVIPVFGRRLDELGYGVADLSLLTGSYAFANLIAAPIWGALADRIGRKPVVVVALLGHLLGNLSYLALTDLTAIIAIRFGHGLLVAGMLPAAMAVIADIAPARQRGRWLAVIMASHGAAFVLGPVTGGALFDLAGFRAPFIASAVVTVPALLIVVPLLRESLTPRLRNRDQLMRQLLVQTRPNLSSRLPRPVSTFAVLLLATFAPLFALSFVEPQLIFFAFDVLDWSTTQVGLILFAYGLSIISMQLTLGGISDRRFERRWVIVAGIVALSGFYWGMTFMDVFLAIFLAAAVSGIGQGLTTPAVGASMLDLAAPHQRGTVMGLRSSASALGAVTGPALAFVVSGRIEPTTSFASAGVFVLLVAIVAAYGLRAKPTTGIELEAEAYRLRSLSAEATLRGLAVQSAAVRLS